MTPTDDNGERFTAFECTYTMNFRQQLERRWREHDTLLCVGLDPDPDRMPASLRASADDVLQFLIAIVDATADLVCAFKPQIAHFHALRAEEQLEALIDHIHTRHPGIPVILDAKRGDIATTAERYAREAFERYRADALTVNPYLGFDSIAPYLDWTDRGLIVLCRTSNPGGLELQHLELARGERLYEYVARLVAGPWNRHGQNALVVGATCPEELARVRELVGDLPLLVPGIGAQGGDIDRIVRAGATSTGGLILNASRSILYASANDDFAAAARRAAIATRAEILRSRDRILAKSQSIS